MTSAKALGCGMPVGAFCATEKFATAMCPGDHGTTYGGNPLACAAVCKVFEIFEKEHIVEHADKMGNYFTEQLQRLQEKHPSLITDVRGKGLMIGIEVSCANGDVVKKALEKGMIVIAAGSNVVRLVPPLVIETKHIDQCISILDSVFAELS